MRTRYKLSFSLTAIILLTFAAYTVYLDRIVVSQFEGKRFSIPAKVYARPLELFVGAQTSQTQLNDELLKLGYRKTTPVSAAGQYSSAPQTTHVFLRSFRFWDSSQKELNIRINFSSNTIKAILDTDTNQAIDIVRIEPLFIGGIYPNQGEDRELIRLYQSPVRLLESLLIVEDQRFYQHIGVDPRGIARAIFKSFKGGRLEGGSTITQQLIKNFFLTSERSFTRKFNEIIMAMLLERRYEKNDILETYLNEVYLGQDNNRAIHGFGLASRFYFKKDIEDLQLHESALLVGMLKGPTYYNPRRSPQRATQRRNLVISQLEKSGLIDASTSRSAQNKPLGVTAKTNIGQSSYPAFLDLVVRQLKRDYSEKDLRSEGLRIFTTLNPNIQEQVESSIHAKLNKKNSKSASGTIESAAIITDTSTGEVQALVGGYHPKYQGFNRALDANRQIGSLVKPAVYLSALKLSETYSLLSTLDDSPLIWSEPGTEDWKPQNYDRKFHGPVPMWVAFAKSYNVPTARLGIEVGLDKVHNTLNELGIEKKLTQHTSSLLGTMELTPFEVTQMYQTMAAGGFYMPLRSIREVTLQDGTALNRYKLKIEQRISKELSYLITEAMQNVVRIGTARSLNQTLSKSLNVAGKTGTSDDLRDSWFAGYTGDKLGVVWVGKDDNTTTGLTGSTGALPIWGDIFSNIQTKALNKQLPDSMAKVFVDPQSYQLNKKCRGQFSIPFIPLNRTVSTENLAVEEKTGNKLKGDIAPNAQKIKTFRIKEQQHFNSASCSSQKKLNVRIYCN